MAKRKERPSPERIKKLLFICPQCPGCGRPAHLVNPWPPALYQCLGCNHRFENEEAMTR